MSSYKLSVEQICRINLELLVAMFNYKIFLTKLRCDYVCHISIDDTQ